MTTHTHPVTKYFPQIYIFLFLFEMLIHPSMYIRQW